MGEVRISELPVAATINGTEQFPVVQEGATKRATVGLDQDIALWRSAYDGYGGTKGVYPRWPGTLVSAGLGVDNGLSFLYDVPVLWSQYAVDLVWTNPAASTGATHFQLGRSHPNADSFVLIGSPGPFEQQGQYVPIVTRLATGLTTTGLVGYRMIYGGVPGSTIPNDIVMYGARLVRIA